MDSSQQPAPQTDAGIEVLLNVYDVVPPSDGTGASANSSTAAITRLNNLTRNLFGGVGGIFHGAIVIDGIEYSFGFCESGSGVYHVSAGDNPMYTFRETVSLGTTPLDRYQIATILKRLRSEWPGLSYDLLSRNCCHFVDVFAEELQVKPVPAWLNRFAVSAATALQATSDASNAVRGVRDELTRLSGESYSWVRASLQRTVQQLQGARQQLPQPPPEDGQARPRGLPQAPPGAVWVGVAQAGSALKAAATKGWHVAINGRVAQDAPAVQQEVDPPAGAERLAGAGGSSNSLASSVSSHRAALPTTALRWVAAAPPGGVPGGGAGGSAAAGGEGSRGDAVEAFFVGSGEPLGMPQPPPAPLKE